MARLTVSPKSFIRACLPHGLVVLHEARRAQAERAQAEADLLPFLLNAELRDSRAGERCFILCTGPSIGRQDLRRLAGELVISVSNAYLHPHFNEIAPAFHCLPQITFGKLTREKGKEWLTDMHAGLGRARIVLSSTERAMVDDHELFAERPKTFLCMEGDGPLPVVAGVPDLTRKLPGPQSVPIMALMLALYLGCREIYLLGTEHDQFLTGRYTYFYKRGVIDGLDYTVGENGDVLTPRYEEFRALGRLWGQYRMLRSCADTVGARIYNATAGGALDEFERVDIGSLTLSGDKVVA